MRRAIAAGIFVLIAVMALAQEDRNYLDIVKVEGQLKSMFDRLYDDPVPGSGMHLYHAIDTLFQEALMLPGSFDHNWDRLDMIGRLLSDDKQVKVFSWMYMASRNEYHYTAYLQVLDRKGEAEVFRLQPVDSEARYSENFIQRTEEWHGKLYYDILTNEYKRKVFYTLLGADFKDSNSKLKTIEVFAIQRGKPVFRGDQFLVGGTVKDRVVLEYSADLMASVRFNENLQMIVADHLEPLHPIYYGNYQFYGPDGSYDGYRFTEGIWVLEEDVDARNSR